MRHTGEHTHTTSRRFMCHLVALSSRLNEARLTYAAVLLAVSRDNYKIARVITYRTLLQYPSN